MARVVVIGGGWGGCGAALTASKLGTEVVLIERMDRLLGTGLVGGIMGQNARMTAQFEVDAMGAGDLFQLAWDNALHRNIEIPGCAHSYIYNVLTLEIKVRALLEELGVQILAPARATDVRRRGDRLEAVVLEDGEVVEGDAFVDATGSAGPQGLCTKYGYGCAMCVLRCPTFGARVSIAAKAGVKEGMSRKANGQVGSVSGGTHLLKETVAPELVKELEQNGHILIPIPEHLKEKLAPKTELAHNTVGHDEGRSKLREYLGVVDDGMFKFMQRPFMPLPFLRQVEGLEKAVYYDPISGGSGNSVRFLSLAPRDDGMRVSGMENLFVGGEKQGLMVGHPEAHVTGLLAGHNAARFALGIAPLVLPRSTVIGEGIAYTREKIYENGEVHVRYDFMAGTLYKQIRELGLYELDPSAVRRRVAELGLEGVMAGQGM